MEKGLIMKRKDILNGIIIFVVTSIIAFGAFFVLDSYSKTSTIFAYKMPKKIGATYMTLNNPFFKIIDEEIRNTLELENNILITLDPALDLEKQIDQIEYLIEQKVDAIILNPVDFVGLRDVLKKANDANIPIFTVDTEVVDKDLIEGSIVSDNYDAGVQCAKDMMKRLDAANIVLLEHSQANSAKERIKGFENTIQKKSNYRIIKRIECNGQLEIAMPLMETYLKTNPDIDVIMALNDPSALGALAALESENMLEDVLVYGVDGTPDTKALIKEGRMQATVAQSPKMLGHEIAMQINNYFQGKKTNQYQREPVIIITKENIDDYSIKEWE